MSSTPFTIVNLNFTLSLNQNYCILWLQIPWYVLKYTSCIDNAAFSNFFFFFELNKLLCRCILNFLYLIFVKAWVWILTNCGQNLISGCTILLKHINSQFIWCVLHWSLWTVLLILFKMTLLSTIKISETEKQTAPLMRKSYSGQLNHCPVAYYCFKTLNHYIVSANTQYWTSNHFAEVKFKIYPCLSVCKWQALSCQLWLEPI